MKTIITKVFFVANLLILFPLNVSSILRGKVTVSEQPFQSSNYKTLTQSSKALVVSPSPVIKIFVLSVHKSKGEDEPKISVSCQWSQVPFKNGSYWLVQYSNGSIVHPQIVSEKLTDGGVNRTHRLDSVIRAIAGDIDKLVCLIPLSTSDKWSNKTYPITAPKIIKASDEDQTFYDTGEDKMIFCDVIGSPSPDVAWYFNNRTDMEVFDVTQNIQTVYAELYNPPGARYALHFNKTTYSIAGVYTCNATNFKGQDLHYVSVRITGFPTWIFWSVAIGFLGFLLIVASLVFICKYTKTKKLLDEERMIQSQGYAGCQTNLLAAVNPVTHNFSEDESLECSNLSEGQKLTSKRSNQNLYKINENDFQIGEQLWLGNNSRVVLGSLTKSGESQLVAAKMLSKWNTDDAKILLEEIKILSYVSEGKNENIIGFSGAITNILERKVVLMMEYCAIGSLKDFLLLNADNFTDHIFDNQSSLIAQNDLCTFDLINWSNQFASGMEYLVSKQVIHGDLSAKNLLLTQERQLKISGFSLFRMTKKYQRMQCTDRSSSFFNAYWPALAIECMQGKPLSTESDVWAFGITLWEIFSLGEDPYSHLTPRQLYVTLLLGQRLPKPIFATPAMYEIMSSCWIENPKERPTFSFLVAEFENILQKCSS